MEFKSLLEFRRLGEERLLGKGAYSQVLLVVHEKTRRKFALKLMKGHQQCHREISIHGQLKHPNIVELFGCFKEKDDWVYMVMEYVPGGNLFQALKHGRVPDYRVSAIFRQVVEAVLFIHERGFIHRDIKPENILLDLDLNPKLCDFGWSADLGERQSFCGTFEYMAPEILEGKEYDYNVDLWALGVLLYEMIEKRAPFPGKNILEMRKAIQAGLYLSKKFSSEEANLIRSLLRKKPIERASLRSVLAHSYFNDMSSRQTAASNYSEAPHIGQMAERAEKEECCSKGCAVDWFS